jgi:hypothetical protein
MLLGKSSEGIRKVHGDGPMPAKKKVDAYTAMVTGHRRLGNVALQKETRKKAAAVSAKPYSMMTKNNKL